MVGLRDRRRLSESTTCSPARERAIMALKVQSVIRREVLDLARVAVETAARDGGLVSADTEARRLLDSHPDCRMSPRELRDKIARWAVVRHVSVEFGFPPLRISN